MVNADSSPVVKNVGGMRVLYVMATQAEYQSHLQERIQPLICQVGPVEAALNVSRFLASTPDVDLVVSLGSAGSATLDQAQVYQASNVSYRDMDASAFGFEKGVTPFLDLPAVVKIGMLITGIPEASLSTGANVVSGEAYADAGADMVDMETWAVMRSCHEAGVPMIGLRGISDGAEPVAEYSDWTRYLEIIDQRLGDVVDQLEADLVNGRLTPTLPQF